MANAPANLDPEKFIIGNGVYGNLATTTPFNDQYVFRLDPAPMPVWTIIIYNLFFGAFFYGFHWVANHVTRGKAGIWFEDIAPMGIGVITCILFTAVTYYSFDRARRLGPWLVYDKASRKVTLPREGETFERSGIVHLQYITTKHLNRSGTGNNERHSELNLITCRDGHRKRWPLLRSIANVRAFDWLLASLLKSTDLPVVRVQDEWRGWNVTEAPYHGSAGN